MEALALKTTPKKHSDALLHIFGFLKKIIGSKQKADVLRTIESYRTGIYPLIVPLTLLNHYIAVHEVPYIQDQFYLNPYPANLNLPVSGKKI
ncbi:MAG: YbgA family protein [Deltaproteobacteria bacterium]|nr:YbgA family protein [Deltaproteobacteria bacterium]